MDVVSKMALSSAGSPAAASDFLRDTFQMTGARLSALQTLQDAVGAGHSGKNLSAAIEQVPRGGCCWRALPCDESLCDTALQWASLTARLQVLCEFAMQRAYA
jgi:hypothetical protein